VARARGATLCALLAVSGYLCYTSPSAVLWCVGSILCALAFVVFAALLPGRDRV
jgi:hypothetical protein